MVAESVFRSSNNYKCKIPSDWIGSGTQDQHTPTVIGVWLRVRDGEFQSPTQHGGDESQVVSVEVDGSHLDVMGGWVVFPVP